jgi:sulfur carrier protein
MPAKGTRRGRPTPRQCRPHRFPVRFFDFMRVMVNGRSIEVQEGLTLADLLAQLGVRREFTAVALNREIARRASHATTVLREGDRLEIVHPMAGGS